MVRHLGSFGRFLAHRARREREDAATLAELAAGSVPLPAGLELRWLGVAGYRLAYQGHALYLDPYVSRVPLKALLGRRPALADPRVHDRVFGTETDEVAGILLGHTHFDHAIDVPLLARRWDTRAYGSASLRRLMALYGLADRSVEVAPKQRYELGPFAVTFFPSVHSKLLLGFKVPYDGEFSCESLDALTPSAYRCGEIYGIRIEVAGATIYHQGSANLIDDEVPTSGVDVFLAGIAGRSFTPDYWKRILPRLRPDTVVASHFDDFFQPPGAPIGFSTNVNLAAFPDEIGEVSREITVHAMQPDPLQTTTSPASA